MNGFEKHELISEQGPVMVLAREGQPPDAGIPLLDLGALELPRDIEAKLREALWARGIREYQDALQPGAAERIAGALRAALKLSVSDIITVAQGEHQILVEAGYVE